MEMRVWEENGSLMGLGSEVGSLWGIDIVS